MGARMNIAKLTGLPAHSHEELREITRRMCYFGARGSFEYISDLVEFLCLNALAKLDPGAHHATVIYDRLCELVGFRFEYEQILAALHRLESKKSIYCADEQSDATIRFGLDVAKISELTKAYKEQVSFEAQVLQAWQEEVQARHPGLSDEEVHLLQEDLEAFSLRLYSMHSIESVSLFFGEDENVAKLLSRMDNEGIRAILPARDSRLHAIRMYELPRFFQNASMERKKYIAQQLNQTFLLHMMQLDPTCAHLLAKEIEVTGGTLFLDTNFVIRLLGIDGPDLGQAAKRLLELSQGLGYRAVVSPRTLEEYRFKIDTLIRQAQDLPPIEAEIAEAALSVVIGRDFYTHHWQSSLDARGYSARGGYFELYREVGALLEQYNVSIETEGDEAIRSDTAALAQEEALLRTALPGLEDIHPAVAEHDAHHRLLILRLRAGYEAGTPLEIPYWFLTCDTKLPVYDRRARPRLGLKVPFCVLSSHWLQLLRPFGAAVEGFDLMQAETLDSPLFRLFPSPPSELVQEVISRMKAHEGIPIEVTTRVLTNSAFMYAFSEEDDEAERSRMLQDHVLGEVTVLLEEERMRMEEEKKGLTSKIDGMETQQLELLETLQESEAQRKTQASAKRQLEQTIRKVQDDYSALSDDLRVSRQQQQEIILEKERLDRHIQEMRSELEKVRGSASEQENLYREAVNRLNQELGDERQRHTQAIEMLQQDRVRQRALASRQQKSLLIILTWIACVALLVAVSPWSRTDNGRWFALTFPAVAAVLTQLIALFGKSLGRVVLAALIVFNLIVLTAAVLLPLGVDVGNVGEAIVGVMAVAQGIASIYALVEHLKSPSEQRRTE